MKTQVAICVGHSRTIGKKEDGGAQAWDGRTNELEFNCKLANLLQISLGTLDVNSVIFDHYKGSSYGAAMKWLASEIDRSGCLCGVELHFNSAGPLAHGHEVLYWHSSLQGEDLATRIERSLTRSFDSPARGAKGLTSKDRGAEFCRLPACPTVIVEPFFGSSKEDWEKVASKPELLASNLAVGIYNYLTRSSS